MAGLGVILVALAIVVALLPVWLPWVLRPTASHFGAYFGSYEREGYGAFALRGVSFTNASVRIEAARVEAAIPTVLLWNHLRGDGSALSVQDWSLVLAPTEESSASQNTHTPVVVVEQTQSVLARIGDWISHAALSNGVVTFQQRTSAVPWLVWDAGKVRAGVVTVVPKIGELPVELSLDTTRSNPFHAELLIPKLELQSDILLWASNPFLKISLTNVWITNRVFAQAQFRDEWMPESAQIQAPALHISETNLPLAGYAAVDAMASGTYTNGAFELALRFAAVSGKTNLPAFNGSLVARGDTNAATLQALNLQSESLRAELSSPVRFNYGGELLSGPASLSLTGDLSGLPLIELQGSARGDLELRPRTGTYPDATLLLELTNVVAREVRVTSATLRSELRWPEFNVIDLKGSLASGAEIHASGLMNVTNRVLSNVVVQLSGVLPTHLVPAALLYSNLNLIVKASGPLTNLSHQVDARIDFLQLPSLVPLTVKIQEHGQQFQIAELRAAASANETTLELSASGNWNGTNATASLKTLDLKRGGAALSIYSLADPVTIELQRATNAQPRLALSPLVWRGENRRVELSGDVSWPSAGDARISVSGLRTSDFTNLLVAGIGFETSLQNLEANTHWSNGPVTLVLKGAARFTMTNALPVVLSLEVTNTPQAIHVAQFHAAVAGENATTNSVTRNNAVIHGEAVLPLAAIGSSNGFVLQIHSNAPLRVDLHTSTNGVLARLVEQFAKLRVTTPALNVALGGTLERPQGTMHFSADSVAPLTMTNRPLPELKAVRAEVEFNLQSVRLKKLRATIAGQSMEAHAEIPIAAKGDLKTRLQIDKAQGQLRMPSADLAAFVPFATNLLAPRGTLDVTVALQPGMQLSGNILISNAATVPFPSIGSIHDIDARIQMRDRSVFIEPLRAQVGGAPVFISGAVDFTRWTAAAKRWPAIQ